MGTERQKKTRAIAVIEWGRFSSLAFIRFEQERRRHHVYGFRPPLYPQHRPRLRYTPVLIEYFFRFFCDLSCIGNTLWPSQLQGSFMKFWKHESMILSIPKKMSSFRSRSLVPHSIWNEKVFFFTNSVWIQVDHCMKYTPIHIGTGTTHILSPSVPCPSKNVYAHLYDYCILWLPILLYSIHISIDRASKTSSTRLFP